MSKDYTIVDQRTNPKGKNLPNRQRFMGRQKVAIKDAVRRKITKTGIEELANKGSKRIRLRSVGVKEPIFQHQQGGVSEDVLPGNKKYSRGDTLPRPMSGGGGGKEGSPDGDGENDFDFNVSREEFFNIIFDGMEIPHIVKKSLTGTDEFEFHRAGFASDGPPNKMDVVRTMGRAFGRRIAMKRALETRKAEAEKRLREIEERITNATSLDVSADQKAAEKLRCEIASYEERIKNVPDIDSHDLLFKRHERTPVPISQAVMFCLLDVSGSMGEWEMEMAKRFFLLLYLFLERNYERVVPVFIRHTQEAKEVSEEEFFHSRESGGTIVSSALQLMKTIVEARYPLSLWNVYGCHASDGDNFKSDNDTTLELMSEDILPMSQYYAYVEVRPEDAGEGQLWPIMESLVNEYDHFAMTQIHDVGDIYPVFRKLFEKK